MRGRLLDDMGRSDFRAVMSGFTRELEGNLDIGGMVDWWMKRIREKRPQLHAAISEEPAGRELLGDLLLYLASFTSTM